jgi:peptide/nickel transport system ATP-binding protein
MSAALLEVSGLTRGFSLTPSWIERLSRGGGATILAVNDVSFSISRGGTFALVGESGCGKSTVARLIAGLFPPQSGSIRYAGRDLTDPAVRRTARVQMIFQDPYSSLNPRWRVRRILAEALRYGRGEGRVEDLLARVGLGAGDAEKFPHQFSGRQRQRISIARALAAAPDLLICDEPTSALDVSVQAQVLNLMLALQRERGLTYLFISHNLAVVRQMADHIGVMYLGRIVESGPAQAVLDNPLHPYTRMLLAAMPTLSRRSADAMPVTGEPPDPLHPPAGCAFHARCPLAQDACRSVEPLLKAVGARLAACHVTAP